jgi:hypothetical protein
MRKFHNMYSSPSIIRMIELSRMRWACNTNGEKRNAYGILVGGPEGRRPLGRPIRRWVNNIKMDLKRDRIWWYGLDLSGLA